MTEGYTALSYERGWSPAQIFDWFRNFYEEELSHKAVTRLDFLEQLTYLLYLKIDHERSEQRPGLFGLASPPAVAPEHGWTTIVGIDGEHLRRQFDFILSELAKSPEESTNRAVFRDARPWNDRHMADLSKLINDSIAEWHWSSHLKEVGQAYERLIQYCAGEIDKKRTAGQVVTPRPLLAAIARALNINAADVVVDPAAGTGGALLAAFQCMLTPEGGERLAPDAYAGADHDPQMVRIATMNILLNTRRPFQDDAPVQHLDSLERGGAVVPRLAGTRAPSVVICNPPFRSDTPRPEARTDLPADTANFPANFLQHIATTLPIGARAAVFVPDNVLTNPTAWTVLSKLMATCDIHTLLRLPSGAFRNGTAQSAVKANVLFLTVTGPRPNSPATEELWVYDARSLAWLTTADLEAFVRAYQPTQPHTARTESSVFGRYTYSDLAQRDFQLYNLYAIPEHEPEPLRPAREIAAEIADSLAEAQNLFRGLADQLP